MKKLIINVIADDNSIIPGQFPFKADNMERMRERCHVHSSDSILLAYDSTIFGSSKKGFVITDKGISTPEWYISWYTFANLQALEAAGSGIINFKGQKKTYTLSVSSGYNDAVRLFQNIRKAVIEKYISNPQLAFDFRKHIIQLILSNEPVSKYIYSNNVPNIDNLKRRCNVHYGEEVLLSYDSTIIGNSKVGFIFTERGIYQRETFGEATFLAWSDFAQAVNCRIDDSNVIVSLADHTDYKVYVSINKELSDFIISLYSVLKANYK